MEDPSTFLLVRNAFQIRFGQFFNIDDMIMKQCRHTFQKFKQFNLAKLIQNEIQFNLKFNMKTKISWNQHLTKNIYGIIKINKRDQLHM